MNIDTNVGSPPPTGTSQSVSNSGSDGSDGDVNFWGSLFDAIGDFGNWMQSVFGELTAGNVSAEQILKAMKEQQRLLIFVMAMSMAAVMFTVYMQEQ